MYINRFPERGPAIAGILNTDPRGYCPCVARLTSGWSFEFNKSLQKVLLLLGYFWMDRRGSDHISGRGRGPSPALCRYSSPSLRSRRYSRSAPAGRNIAYFYQSSDKLNLPVVRGWNRSCLPDYHSHPPHTVCHRVYRPDIVPWISRCRPGRCVRRPR